MEGLQSDGSSSTREGVLPRVWEILVLVTLGLAVNLTARDLYAFQWSVDPAASRPSRFAWLLYLAAQLANKLPFSYRYSARGTLAAADVLGFLMGMTSVALFWLQVAVPTWVAITLITCIATWLALTTFITLARDNSGASLQHRLLCRIIALVLYFPMLGSAFALAAR